MNRRQKIIVSVTGIFLVLLILVGLTYAYFLTRIDGNEAEKSISVTTANLSIKYGEDDPTIISKELIKPDTVIGTKEFHVTNTGNAITEFSIIIDEVENNFVNTDDLEYVLKKDEEVLKTGTIKRMEAQIILSNVSIAVDEVQNYSLTVTYKESNTDQSIDMNKKLSLRINIRRVSEWEKADTEAESLTLLAAIKRDNEVVDVLTTPGKSLSGYKYSAIRNSVSYDGLNAHFEDTKYYVYSPNYIFDTLNGMYYFTNPIKILGSEITDEIVFNNYFYGVAQSNEVEVSEIDENTGLETVYKMIEKQAEKVYKYEFYVSGGSKTNDEAVLSSTEDDYGTSYYFRGSVENNYVTYNNMCWRILRVEGNGNIKLLLADENYPCSADVEANEDGTFSGYSKSNYGSGLINDAATYAYNTNNGSVKYEESSIPGILEDWAIDKGLATKNNEIVTYDESIAKTNWCNDTTVTSTTSNGLVGDASYYAAYDRLAKYGREEPTLICNSVGLSGSSTKVNANIGLLTADEIIFAGPKMRDNVIYPVIEDEDDVIFIYTNSMESKAPWTMTPQLSRVKDGQSFGVIYSSGFENYSLTSEAPISPSIVLKNSVIVTTKDVATYGEPGTQSNPYIIS